MLAQKSDFIGLEGITHLATGGEPPLLKAHRDAFEDFARDKASGQNGYRRHWLVAQEVRARLGRLTAMAADDIALVGSASEAINRAVSSIDWQAGDSVVTPEIEFASGRYGLTRLEKLGVQVRMIPSRGGVIEIGDLIEACDSRTRLLLVSQVSYLTGQQIDVAQLSDALEGRDIVLLIDASHALGVVPVDARLSDFVVCCGYKWLLSTHTGILVWNRERRPEFEPLGVGWNSATQGERPGQYNLLETAGRAEVGNPNHLDTYLMRTSLDYLLNIGIDEIAANAHNLGGHLRAELFRMGAEVLTPEPKAARAGNIAFAHPDYERIMQVLAAEKFLVWGDNGRIRLSVHAFVDCHDIERFLKRIADFL
ncbi:aminotransferase class V-fold PLP-dependent enzyme [Pelagibius sp. Alg239-R121]|uniref:aminotransferase class V-fold PLP-dependent enzyme n=1 Tax=Pelagibius sp. Alg239-R121 TaxID=2993448 RepID=UPI0024A799AB|nr:aminotransferase class V-fold PLP-dependent enzyme [Pelagibius sp. Alg239-R121]